MLKVRTDINSMSESLKLDYGIEIEHNPAVFGFIREYDPPLIYDYEAVVLLENET